MTCCALASTLAPALVGCSSSRNIVVDDLQVERIRTQLTFFGNKYEPLNVTAIEDILRSYMDDHPDTSIVYEGIKGAAYFDALLKRIASGNGDDAFMVDHDTALELVAQGRLAPLDDLSTIGSFSELALGQMRSEGSIYYVPTSVSAFGLYCNTALLAERGLEAPQTFPAFLDACEAFMDGEDAPVVANNDISLKTFALARGMAPVYAQDDAYARIAAFNERPEELAKRLREGFDAVGSLIDRGYVDAQQALVTEKTSDDLDQFVTGRRPFMLTGAWASVRVHDMAPDLAFEVHPYPALDDGPSLVVNVDTRVSVNAEGSNVDESKRFVEHLTRPESIVPFANSQCSFSPLEGNAASDDSALLPLVGAFDREGVVIGSDDNLRFPIWNATKRCVKDMLEGASPAEAETTLLALLEPQGGDAV